MGFTKEELKKAEQNGRVTDTIDRIQWKKLMTDLLKRKNKFLSAGEIRDALKATNVVYVHLRYHRMNGTLKARTVDGKIYYGLKEW